MLNNLIIVFCLVSIQSAFDWMVYANDMMSTIQVTVRCDKITELKSGIYENFHVEYDPGNSQVQEVNSINQILVFQYSIQKPSLIELYTNLPGSRYRLYLKPGGVLSIQIDCDNIYFSGSDATENEILKNTGFNRAPLSRPIFGSIKNPNTAIDSFGISAIMDSIDNYYAKIFSAVKFGGLDDDFKRYLEAEEIGAIYFWKHSYLFNSLGDTIGIDSLKTGDQDRIRGMFDFKLLNESRSRYYINALSAFANIKTKNALSAKDQDNFYIWLAEYKRQRDILVSFSSDIKAIYDVSFINTVISRAQDIDQLEYGEYLFNMGQREIVGQENAFNIIQEELDRKRIRFNLTAMKDYDLAGTLDSSVLLSESLTNSKYTFLYFWATWCAPCLDKMPEVLGMANDDLVVVPVNMWSSKSAWTKTIENFDNSKSSHLFASKTTSDMIAHDCAFRSMPYYAIVDKNLNIIHIPKDLDAVKTMVSQLPMD